jgi:outer membrane protein
LDFTTTSQIYSSIHNMNKATIGGKFSLLMIIYFLTVQTSRAQTNEQAVSKSVDLNQAIEYALGHQPLVKQSEIDQEITNKIIKGKLADWFPQLNAAYNYQRFIDLQASVIGGNVIRFGVNNTSSVQFTATQSIFNRDVLLASSTANKVRQQSQLNTSKSKIDLVVNVTKAFYDLLATAQQIRVNEESIVRLQRSLKDSYNRYKSGIADKTDYKRATILLGNAEALLKANVELLKVKESSLKTLMGYPTDQSLEIKYDTLQLENEILLDTAQELHTTSNIDYKILYSQRELQDANVRYSSWAFLPSLNAFGAYNLNFQNNAFKDLYATKYPFSFVGTTLSIPVFQGGKRIAKLQEQKLVGKRLDESLTNLKNSLTTEYTRALATYKSNLKNYQTQKENVELAREVFEVIQLQYNNGVRTYLDVTVAESDLRTTKINYFNSLYQVLASKMDVLRALGEINY